MKHWRYGCLFIQSNLCHLNSSLCWSFGLRRLFPFCIFLLSPLHLSLLVSNFSVFISVCVAPFALIIHLHYSLISYNPWPFVSISFLFSASLSNSLSLSLLPLLITHPTLLFTLSSPFNYSYGQLAEVFFQYIVSCCCLDWYIISITVVDGRIGWPSTNLMLHIIC